MKMTVRVQQAFIFVLLSLGAPASICSASVNYCNHVLSRILAPPTTPSDYEEIDTLVEAAQDFHRDLIVPFSKYDDLAPFFQSGLLYLALGEQLEAQGHRSKKERSEALSLVFPYQSVEEKIEFINGVVLRAAAKLGSLKTTQLSRTEREELRTRGEKIHLSPEAFTQLLRVMEEESHSDYLAIKVALLKELENEGDHILVKVPEATRLSWFFSQKKDSLPTPASSNSTQNTEKIISLESHSLSRTLRRGLISDEFFISALNEIWMTSVGLEDVAFVVATMRETIADCLYLKTDEGFEAVLDFTLKSLLMRKEALPAVREDLRELARHYKLEGSSSTRREMADYYLSRVEEELERQATAAEYLPRHKAKSDTKGLWTWEGR